MTENQTSESVELGSFLETAGQSFTEAQNSLIAGLDFSSNVVLNNAELEVKVTVSSERGKFMVRPVSSEEIRTGTIDPGLLSTLHISYVSTLEEKKQVQPEVTAPVSNKEPGTLIDQVLARKDIQKLTETKGELQVKPTFVADRNRWLISVEDSKGRVLREIVLPD